MKDRTHTLKKDFMLAVTVALLAVVLASAATLYGCYRMQKVILPDSKEVWLYTKTTLPDGTVTETSQKFTLDLPSQLFNLVSEDAPAPETGKTEYTIERIESSFSALSANQKILYRTMSALMVILPLVYSVVGIGLSAWWFYRKKIAPPIRILNDATAHISNQDLDFEVVCQSQDELGQLCSAFEKMRRALYENNRQMWRMLEQRRTLQASVAHDLRNPIMILSGTVEYMQENIPNGKLAGEKLQHTLQNLAITAKRMERYTDYIRDLHSIEEIEVQYTEVHLPDFLDSAADTLRVLASSRDLKLECAVCAPDCSVKLDSELFYRILENLLSNAVRYAKEKIGLEFHLNEAMSDCTHTSKVSDIAAMAVSSDGANIYITAKSDGTQTKISKPMLSWIT